MDYIGKSGPDIQKQNSDAYEGPLKHSPTGIYHHL